jgi:hypothetical protein
VVVVTGEEEVLEAGGAVMGPVPDVVGWRWARRLQPGNRQHPSSRPQGPPHAGRYRVAAASHVERHPSRAGHDPAQRAVARQPSRRLGADRRAVGEVEVRPTVHRRGRRRRPVAWGQRDRPVGMVAVSHEEVVRRVVRRRSAP